MVCSFSYTEPSALTVPFEQQEGHTFIFCWKINRRFSDDYCAVEKLPIEKTERNERLL